MRLLARACLVATALVLSAPALASAQARVQIEASATRLAPDEELQIGVRASGRYDELTQPTSDGFDFRQAGRQTQVTIVNGEMARIETYSFTGAPRRPGRYTIGPVELRASGQVVARSETVVVEVVADDAAARPAESVETATNLSRYSGEAFFVRPSLSANSPFAGQPVVLTFELYWSRTVRLHGIRETASPRAGDADVEKLTLDEAAERESVQIGGHPYMRQVTHRMLVTPPKAGNWRIDGPSYKVEAGDVFESRAVKVQAPPMEVVVRPVPTAGRPPGFRDGQIGKLRMTGRLGDASQDGAQKVKPGQRLLLVYEVEGEGNLLGVRTPELQPQPGMTIESLPGKSDEGVKRTPSGTEGKRNWQSVLSFNRPGHYVLPAVAFAAFDPFDEKFTTSTAGPFAVDVVADPAIPGEPEVATATPAAPGTAAASATPGAPGQAAGAVHLPASALLRPIAAQARLADTATAHWTAATAFRWLLLLPWLVALALVVGRFLLRRRAFKSPEQLRASALRSAMDRVRAAPALGSDRGYADLRHAVTAYVQTAWRLQTAGLTEPALAAQLRAAGADPAAVDQLLVELQHCDFARFAPGGERETDLGQTAMRLADILARLDASRDPKPGATRAPGMAASVAGLAVWLSLGALLAPSPVRAATLDETFARANAHYVAGRYAEAEASYRTLLEHAVRAPAIHYNLANTLVKQKRLGEAVGHFKQAMRQEPDAALKVDADFNLAAVRGELADRSRRRHATLHIFDESPELDVAVARAAPRGLLGVLALLAGWGAVVLLGLKLLGREGRQRPVPAALGLVACLVVYAASAAWLWHAQRIDSEIVHAVVIEEDAALAACQGVGETVGLPEGLEVRKLTELADGRVEVRLPNGREGCLARASLYAER